MATTDRGLTDKQAAFAREYLVDCCAAKAAVRAGYAENSAREQGYQLLGNPKVADAIAEAMKARAERTGATADRVVQELVGLAYADITDAVTWGDAVSVKDDETGEVHVAQGVVLVAEKDLPPHIRGAIAEVAQTRDGIKIKMHSKTAAIDMLAKHLGVYAPEKRELTGKNGGPIETKELTNDERARRVAALVAEVQAASALS